MHAVIIIKYSPISNRKLLRIAFLTEVLLVAAHICASFYIFDFTYDVDTRMNVGWALIGLLLAVIMVNLIGMLIEVFYQIKDVAVQMKRMCLRLRQVTKRRSSVKIKRISRTSIHAILHNRLELEATLEELGGISGLIPTLA